MFCPACKAEYRLGFTHCSDCDVDLVENSDQVPANAVRQGDLDNPALVWTGTSGEAQAALCSALEASNIPFTPQERDVGIMPGLAQPVYAVSVKQRDLDAATVVLENVREHFETTESGADDAASASQEAAESGGEDEDFGLVPDDIAPDFNPEDATQEVWSGADADLAETVRICLRENGIGCVMEESKGERRILVVPACEVRAKEIIGEIARGTPTP
jgi:hypothetical protein